MAAFLPSRAQTRGVSEDGQAADEDGIRELPSKELGELLEAGPVFGVGHGTKLSLRMAGANAWSIAKQGVNMRIFIVHAGGLGDLVLFAPALKAIRAAMPQAQITLCCRREFASIEELLPFGVDCVLGLAFNPYAFAPFEASAFGEVSSLVASVRSSEPDLFISAECIPTWLTPLLIAAMHPMRSLAAQFDLRQTASLQRIFDYFDLIAVPCEMYGTGEAVPEHARYDAILECIGASKTEPLTFQYPQRIRDEATRVINDLNLGDASILACFTAGSSGLVPIKRWPLDRFVSVIDQAARRHGLVPVFFGDASERAEVEQAVRTLAERGVHAHAYSDTMQSIPLTAAIVARASAFLGNDTGLAHLCAALQIPGVTVYGGGYFEKYEPWAPGTIGVVHRLPCFGCAWDCSFGHAVCVESIETADVVAALDRVLRAPPLAPEVVELSHRTESELCLIGDAARTYRAVQADRIQRLEVIAGLQREVESIRKEMERQSVAAAERLGVIEELEAHIGALRGEREAAARAAEEPLLRQIGMQETMIRELGKEIETLS